MKTKSITLAALALIASTNLISAPIYAEGAKPEIENPIHSHLAEEISPCDIARFMDNPYHNSFSNFRIVTNAYMEDLNTVIVGEDAFLLSDWGFYSETPEVIVLFNTRGTEDVTDDVIISVYESPNYNDDSAELELYENLYNDMWNLR